MLLRRIFTAAAWVLPVVGVLLVLIGLQIGSSTVDHVVQDEAGVSLTIHCGSPASPETDFAVQRDAALYLERAHELMREVYATSWRADCKTLLAQKKSNGEIVVVGGVALMAVGLVGIVVVVMTWTAERRRRAHGPRL